MLLLDVLVENLSGRTTHLADVTLRYKDLVYFRNGIAKTRLELPNQDQPDTPLQRHVWKNFLAQRLALTIQQAGQQLAKGDYAESLELVRGYQQVLQEISEDWQNDQELQRDLALLQQFGKTLDDSASLQQAALSGRCITIWLFLSRC